MNTEQSAPSPRRPRTSRSLGETGTMAKSPTAAGRATRAAAQADEAGSPTRGSSAPPAPQVADRDDVAAAAPGGVRPPEATLASLELERGAIGRLDAEEIAVSQGAIGAARAETIHIEMGAIGAAMANEADISQAGVGTLLTSHARLGQAAVRTIVARDVVVERPSLVGFLLAQRVSGDVRVLFDWRGAVVFGVLFGLLSRLGRGRR